MPRRTAARKAGVALLTLCLLAPWVRAEEDEAWAEKYQAWYEEYARRFKPPDLGREIELVLSSGHRRRGTLERLEADRVAIRGDRFGFTYYRSDLAPSTRTRLWAEDYAHYHAGKKLKKEQRRARREEP